LDIDQRRENSMSTNPTATQPARSFRSRGIRAGIVVAILAVGAAGGFGFGHYVDRAYPHSVLLLQPTPIAQAIKAAPVAFKGQVAEIFGGKFVLQDESGRALIDTGPRGDNMVALPKGEIVTVQGYFDNGLLHADVLTRADGSTEAFGPPGPPRPHRFGPPGPMGGPGAWPPMAP
jgi:hypothetical protein